VHVHLHGNLVGNLDAFHLCLSFFYWIQRHLTRTKQSAISSQLSADC
jgi:hypothetical protein